MSGCLNIDCSTLNGIVPMSAPASAAWLTCSGPRRLAARTWVLMSCCRYAETMSRTICMPSSLMSSTRPTNGLMMYAPIAAARSAWFTLKQSVTLMRMPSPARIFPAARPSGVSGTFTMTFLCHEASRRPSTRMSSFFSLTTSAETLPTMPQIFLTCIS